MIVYKVQRSIEEYNFNDDNFLSFLKEKYKNNKDYIEWLNVDKLSNVEDVSEFYLDDLEEFLNTNNILNKYCDIHTLFYEDYEEAYEDMNFGVH